MVRYKSCHVVATSTLKTKQRHTKNVRVIEVKLDEQPTIRQQTSWVKNKLVKK